MYLFAICMSSLEKYLFRSSDHFIIGFCLFLLLSGMSSLYILDINLSSDTWISNISPHLVCCLFIFLMISFVMQRYFSLISHLLPFSFVAFILMLNPKKKKKITKTDVKELTTCFFLGILQFQVLHSHFKFIFKIYLKYLVKTSTHINK